MQLQSGGVLVDNVTAPIAMAPMAAITRIFAEYSTKDEYMEKVLLHYSVAADYCHKTVSLNKPNAWKMALAKIDDAC